MEKEKNKKEAGLNVLAYTCKKCHQSVRFGFKITQLEGGAVTHDGNAVVLDSINYSEGGQHEFGSIIGH